MADTERMPLPQMGTLTSLPALDHPELLGATVHAALTGWASADPSLADQVAVIEIDPALADTAAMTEAYDVALGASANCVVVVGSRSGEERIAACVVRADTRADVNTVVRKLLDVRKASFLPMDRAVAESGMEHGGITPIGLPPGWRILVDEDCLEIPAAVIGPGVRRSQLLVPGRLLGEMSGAEVLAGLGR